MVCPKEVSAHCRRRIQIDIRQAVWAISANFTSLVALTKPEQPTAASKHDTEEDTREARGSHRKQAAKAPTHRKALDF